MKAKSISGNSLEEVKKAFEKSIADGYKPTLAIIFISIKQDRTALCELLQSKGIDILGATSSGEFINGQQSEGGIALMLFDLDKNDYSILFEDIGERNIGDAAQAMAHKALQKFKHPAFILCSTSLTKNGVMLNGEALIENIESVIGPQVTIFGGMAGDDMTFTGTYVFTKKHKTDYGMVSLILNEEKINLYGVAISGWKPLGISKTITKSEGNHVFTIDDKPALEVYSRYLIEDKDAVEDQINFFESVFVDYPIQIERANRDPKLCTPIGYDKEKKGLIFESVVPQGSKFRFSMPPDFDIVETVVDSANTLKNKTNAEAEAVLIFSCAGRLSTFGPMARQENEGIAEVWSTPMAGFYSYGEYGKSVSGKHEFHTTTNSWVALKEK